VGEFQDPRAGIPEAWVVDLNGERVLVFLDPNVGEYASMQTFQRGQALSPRSFPDLSLSVSDFLS
jgi:Uma2 family endonuclease